MPQSIPRSEPPAVLRYGAAIAAVVAAVAAGSLLRQAGGNAPLVSLLLCGVLFATWFGGLGPGLLAIALSVLAFAYFFLQPLYSLAVQDYNDIVRLISFAVAALFVVALSARQTSTAQSLRRAHADLQTAVRELEKANALLRQSEKSLQTIIDTIPALVVRYRADGAPDFMNQTVREFVGPGVGLDAMKSAVHPDDLPQNFRNWQAHVAAGEPYENEMRLRRADGVHRWHRIRRVPLRDANGTIVNWYGAGHDIDDLKRAETALRESEKSLQTIIDTIPAHVVRYRADGAADFMNQTLREFVGLAAGPAGLDGMNSTVHPDDLQQRLRDWPAHVAAGEPYENEMRFRRADGVYRWQHLKRVPLRDANGAIVNWYGAGHDIDDQKRAEDALRESEYKLRQIFETVPGLLWSTAPDGEPAYVNQRILDYLGKPFEDFKQDGWEAFIHPDDLPETERDFSQAIQTGASHEAVHRLRRADGEYRWHHTRAEPLRDQQGRTIQWYGLSVDIDEAKKAEDRLRRSESYLAEAQRLSHSGVTAYKGATVFYGSEEIYRIWGFDPAQGVPSRKDVLQRIHPDDFDRLNTEVERALGEKRRYSIAYRIVLPDGTVKHLESIGQPMFSTNGELVEVVTTQIDVTERKRAEQTLRESEAHLAEARRELQAMIDTIPAMVGSYDAKGSLTYANKTALDYTGVTVVEGMTDRRRMLVHPDDRDQTRNQWRASVATGEPFQTELRLRRCDGEYRWVSTRRVPLRDSSGKVVRWYGVAIDIEDRKRAEQALRKNEAELIEAKRELQETIDIIPMQVARYSPDFKRDFVNAAWKQFTGVSDEAAGGTGWSSAVHPDDLAIAEKGWRDAALAEGEPTYVEARLRRADGQYRWFAVYRVALRDENGKIAKWYSTGYDIEERKRAEDALRRSEAHLAEAQRLSHTGVVTYNGTALVYASEETFRIWGFDAAHGLPTREAAFQRIHPGDRDRLNAEVRRAVSEKRRYSVAYRIILPDGTVKHLETIGQPVFSASGKLLEIVATQTDVTDRKRAEDALRRSEAYLAEAQQLSVTGSFGWSIADNLIVWSQETYHILEINPAVKPTLDLVFERTHPDDIPFVRRTIEQLATEERDFDFEHRLLLPGGTVKHLHVRTHRVQFEGGKAEVVGAVMDVTASREAEEALRSAQAELAHASRVATLGELSASIAHEVHQPLTAIAASGNAAVRWLDRAAPESAQAISSITRIINEAHRASQVIHRIRELAKKAEPVMSQVDVNGLIEDVLVLIGREAARQRVEVRPQLASELPPALGDRVQLQQVLINLVMNGIQAMAPATDRARVIVIRTERHDAGQILVAVEDTGIGIEGENLDRLFGAFYTTKPDGMGMGLSISRSIVEAHGGSIWATRNSGPGVTFQFTLSQYHEQAAASLVS